MALTVSNTNKKTNQKLQEYARIIKNKLLVQQQKSKGIELVNYIVNLEENNVGCNGGTVSGDDATKGYVTFEISFPTNVINDDIKEDLEISKDDCEILYIVPRLKCNICGEIYKIVDTLADHILATHSQNVPFKDQCLICGEIFDVSSLDLHMRTTHDEFNPYRCKFCARRFSTRSDVTNHCKYLHDDLKKPFECDICGRMYETSIHLQNHKAEQHKKVLNCPYCVKCFERNYDLKFHLGVHLRPGKIKDPKSLNFESITFKDTQTINNDIILERHNYDESCCFICGSFIDFENGDSIETHLNEHHRRNGIFQCSDCKFICDTYDEYVEHIQQNHSKMKISNRTIKPYFSVIPKLSCGFITRVPTPEPNADTDSNHLMNDSSNSDDNKLPERLCILCKKVFRNTEEYDNHMKRHTKSMVLRNTGPLGTISWRNKRKSFYPYYCKLCKRYFILGTTFLLHNKRVHKKLKPFKCAICDMDFTQDYELEKHRSKHVGFKQFECERCEMKFMRRRNLRNHLLFHKHNYKCNYCGCDCSSTLNVEKHIKKHIGDIIAECAFCEAPYVNVADMNNHINRAHNVNPDIWECRLCHKSCNSANEIMQHNKSEHAGEKPYQCDQCNRKFALLHSLVNHKIIHSGEKNHICKYCDKKFTYASYLKMHIRQHTGERPYVCTFCPKTFARLANLYEHKKQHLCGESRHPYTCEVCGKGYASLSSFNKHKILHTGVKSFKCDLCEKSYAQKIHLTRHSYSHASDKVFNCTICDIKFKSPMGLTKHEKKSHGLFKLKAKNCSKKVTKITNEEAAVAATSTATIKKNKKNNKTKNDKNIENNLNEDDNKNYNECNGKGNNSEEIFDDLEIDEGDEVGNCVVIERHINNEVDEEQEIEYDIENEETLMRYLTE